MSYHDDLSSSITTVAIHPISLPTPTIEDIKGAINSQKHRNKRPFICLAETRRDQKTYHSGKCPHAYLNARRINERFSNHIMHVATLNDMQ